MRAVGRFACALLWLAVALPAWAASVSLSLGSPQISVEQATTLTVAVVGVQPRAIPAIEPVEGLDIRFRSQSTQFISNTQGIVQIYRFVYEVAVRAPGTYTIGPVEVSLPTGTERADPVTLRGVERAAAALAEPLSATAQFSAPEVWEGQVVLYRAAVTAQQPVRDVAFQFPPFEGLRAIGSIEAHTETIRDPEGDITIVEHGLPMVASAPGDRTQAPSVARVQVLLRAASPWGVSQARTRTVTTSTAPLLVRPLPPPPPGFQGLVGEFTLRSTLARTEGVAVGESVPWTVDIVGDGVLDGFELALPNLPEARVYRDAHQATGRVQDGAWLARKRFTQVLVPTAPGRLQLPPLELVVFSPQARDYVTLRADLGVIEVEGEGAAVDVQTFGAEAPTSQGPAPVQLVDIYTWGPSITPPLPPLLPLGLGLACLPGLLVLGLDGRDGARRWWASRRVRSAVAVRGRGRLRHLPSEPEARMGALDAALREVLADRVGTPTEQLRRDEALSALDPQVADVVRAAFEGLDRARFAGGPQDPLQAQVTQALDALESA